MARLKSSIVALAALLVAASAVAAPPAAATKAPPAAAGHGSADTAFEMPTTYAGAVTEIEARIAAIAKLIDDGQLAKIHQEAAVIRKVADGMSKLVAATGSGVPPSAYPVVLKASKGLSDLFASADAAGDSGDVAASRKAHERLAQQAAILRRYAPTATADFTCPMHPEVTSPTMSKCSKCGMDLEKRAPKPPAPARTP